MAGGLLGALCGARHASESRVLPSTRRRTTGKRVILNMTAQAETTREFFHSPNGHMALKPDRGFQAEIATAGRHYFACSTAGVMSVTWIALLASSTVPETLTIFPTNFFAVVWSSS